MTNTPTKNFGDTPTKSDQEGRRTLICHFRQLPTHMRAIFLRQIYVKYSMSVVSILYTMTSTNHLEPLSYSIISLSPLVEKEIEMESTSVMTEEEGLLLNPPVSTNPPPRVEIGDAAPSTNTTANPLGDSPRSTKTHHSTASDSSLVRRGFAKLFNAEDSKMARREDWMKEAKAKSQSARDAGRNLSPSPDGSEADVTLRPSSPHSGQGVNSADHQPHPPPVASVSEPEPPSHSTPDPSIVVPAEPPLARLEGEAGSQGGEANQQPQNSCSGDLMGSRQRSRRKRGKGSGNTGKNCSKTAEQGKGDTGAQTVNPSEVFATGDAVATIAITRAGEGGDAHNSVARALFQLPEFFNVLSLRPTPDGAVIDVDNGDAEDIVRRHLVPQGWTVFATPIWPRYQFVVPTQLSGTAPGSGLDPATIVRGLIARNTALFGFPAGSVNYVNHTWESVEEEAGTSSGGTRRRMRIWVDVSPEAETVLISRGCFLATLTGAVRLRPSSRRPPSRR